MDLNNRKNEKSSTLPRLADCKKYQNAIEYMMHLNYKFTTHRHKNIKFYMSGKKINERNVIHVKWVKCLPLALQL